MDENKLGYIVLEVGGIQKYILSSGKLKEMIGGSELIESLASDYLDDYAEKHDYRLLTKEEIRQPKDREILPLQRNAGALHLLCSSYAIAHDFLKDFALEIIDRFPGLPLFGALESCDFTSKSLREAKFKLSRKIGGQRNLVPVAAGLELLPICEAAPLDGKACVYLKNNSYKAEENISLASQTRRSEFLLEKARKRLRRIEGDEFLNDKLVWSDNLDDLVGNKEKLAFIHIDGNDLGMLFRKRLESDSRADEREIEKRKKQNKELDLNHLYERTKNSIKKMLDLSDLVKNTTNYAFKKALTDALRYAHLPKGATVPARPLVLGGDDVTVIIRADLALIFIDSFVKAFERYSRENNQGEVLSVGVGMVVCAKSYPFLKAFSLAEELLKSAKNATLEVNASAAADKSIKKGKKNEQTDPLKIPRASSLDYLVITNDVDADFDCIKEQYFKAQDQSLLTKKPIILKNNNLANFVASAIDVLESLPRSYTRSALNDCKIGVTASKNSYAKLLDNLKRNLGGRHNHKLMSQEEFLALFPENYGFFLKDKDGRFYTKLGDYLELGHLLSSHSLDYLDYFSNQEKSCAGK